MPVFKDTIKNDRLELIFRLPRRQRESMRFDAAGCVARIVLDGKHQFCESEQIVAGRPDHHGLGLCGEFKWDDLACEVKPGEKFPKFGVGLLTQLPEGGPYSIRNHDRYTLFPFVPYETNYELRETGAVFTQLPIPCLGLAAEIWREYRLMENRLELITTVTNKGERDIHMAEYQHNFVSIDNLPIGPGYRLRLPFLKAIKKLEDSVADYNDKTIKIGDVISVSGDTAVWKQSMDGRVVLYQIGTEDILPVPENREDMPFWKLSHDDSPASVSEFIFNQPVKVVHWGVGHCMCVEAWLPVDAKPGESASWRHLWVFED